MKETPMGKDYCPNCNKLCDTATDPTGEHVPMPGDLSICLYCENVNQYADDMALVKFPEEEFEKLPQDLKHTIDTYVLQLRISKEKLKKQENENS